MSSCVYVCNDFHKSCLDILLKKIFVMLKFTLKLYTIFYFATSLTKPKNYFENFKETIKGILYKILKSAVFVSGYMVTLRATFCLISHTIGFYNIYCSILQVLISSIWILFEPSDRIIDLCLFTIPRSIESLTKMVVDLKLIPSIPNMIQLIFSSTMVIGLYMKDQRFLKKNALYAIDFLLDYSC
jgi:hypothetical protein